MEYFHLLWVVGAVLCVDLKVITLTEIHTMLIVDLQIHIAPLALASPG